MARGITRTRKHGDALVAGAGAVEDADAEGPPWRFRCYVDERKRDVIDEWKSGLSKTAQANLERTLDHLRKLEKRLWSKPQPASSLGDHIYVIRFKDESGMQHRLFGHFIPKTKTFVMTLSGFEKGEKYVPADYEQKAKKRRDLSAGSDRTRECFAA